MNTVRFEFDSQPVEETKREQIMMLRRSKRRLCGQQRRSRMIRVSDERC